MKQICKITGKEFEITQNEINIYEKLGVPLPEIHPEEALIRRLAFRNERNLYRTTDSHSGETILSTFSEENPIKKIYHQDFWRSDGWDPMEYGREYDFSRTFFGQFQELIHETPWPNLTNWNIIDSDYCNYAGNDKNCYMDIGGDGNEDCLFIKFCFNCTDSMDMYWCNNMNLCYECMYSEKCFKTFFAEQSTNCSDSWLLYNCTNCQDCFGCVNLKNKRFCIWNEQYTESEYREKLAEMNPQKRSNLNHFKKEFEQFKISFPVKYADILQSDNCSGNHLKRAHNCTHCFDVQNDIENCHHVIIGGYQARDITNTDHVGLNAELVVNSSALPTNNHVVGSWVLNMCNNIHHSIHLTRSSNCFGCFGLKDAQYCILNKQYTKEGYKELLPKIKQHMIDMPLIDRGITYTYGDFFPLSFSPYAYNETAAYDYFPKTKEEVLAEGFQWKEKNKNAYAITLSSDQIPDEISQVDDTILSQIIECADKDKDYSAGAFRIVASELALYKQIGIPLPLYSPQARHMHREQQRTSYKLWERTTDDGVIVLTPYAPDRPEKILSEEAYKREVL